MPEFDGLIRFDSADADWLAAYAHLVAGFGELTLAADPTPVIRRVNGKRAMSCVLMDGCSLTPRGGLTRNG